MAKETEEQIKAREMVEEIATNIAQLSRQVNAILGGRLKKQTIVVLLAHLTKLPQWNVEKVLEAISSMESELLKK